MRNAEILDFLMVKTPFEQSDLWDPLVHLIRDQDHPSAWSLMGEQDGPGHVWIWPLGTHLFLPP